MRELTRVATAETEADWLAAAEGLVANQIERLVANHHPGDRPDDPPDPDLRPRVVRLELPPEVYALWRQARMVVAAERGAEISDADGGLLLRCDHAVADAQASRYDHDTLRFSVDGQRVARFVEGTAGGSGRSWGSEPST